MLKRTFIALAIIFSGASVFLFNSFYKEAKNTAITKLNEEQMIHARQAAQGIEDFFATWTRSLNSLSKLDAVIDNDAVGKRYLKLFYEANQEQIKSITRLDKSGRIIFNLPSSKSVGTDLSDQKHVRELLQKHQPVISDVFKAVEGFHSVALHVPVFRGSEFQGSIGILIDFESLAKRYLDVIRIGETGYAWVVGRDGTILYTPVAGLTGRAVSEVINGSPTLMAMVGEMLKGHAGAAKYTFDRIGDRNVGQTTKYAVYMPVRFGETFWSISVASAEQDVLSGLVSFRDKLALVIGALFICGMVFSTLGAKAWLIVKEEEKSRQIDRQLRDSKLSLSLAVESAGLGLWSIDKDTGQIWASDRALEMYGFKATDTVTMERFLSIVHEEDRDRVVQVIEEVFRNQEPASMEYRLSLPDGSLRWMAARGCYTFSPSGSAAMTGISNDITERKLVEHELVNHRDYLEELVRDRTEKLRQALETAETANQAKSMFLANMSHELRTPLNAVLGFAQLLERDPSLSPQGRNRARTIMKSGGYLLSIINDVLAMSRIEAGRIELRATVVDLGDLLRDLAAMFRLQTEEKGLSFSIDCAEDLPRLIMADIGKLNQVLINLLGNAVKFTRQGSISLRAFPAGIDRIVVEIEDTGIGISLEEREALFDPFVRSKNGEQCAGGTGLGLAISRQYAQLMGGGIAVASTLDSGSCFRFEFHAPPASTQPFPDTAGQRVVGLAPGQEDIQETASKVPSLERMSPAWLKLFSLALSRGNITRIRHLGDEARDADPLLSAYLLDRADLYDLEGLRKLVPARDAA